MTTMLAARLHEFGGALQIEQIHKPSPRPTDVVVRVKASEVVPNLINVMTHYSTWFPYFPLPKLPATFGLGVAGVVEEVGTLVHHFQPGDRVYVNPARTCGSCHACRTGEPTACIGFTLQGFFGTGPESERIFDAYPDGGLAEYISAPVSSLVRLNDKISDEQGAHFSYLGTAYSALKKAGVNAGKSMILTGATGTLGVPAVLLALSMGVGKIFAIARNKKLLEQLRELDPMRIFTLSYGDEPVGDWVSRHTEGRGADILVESMSTGASAQVTLDALYALRRGGTAVLVGGMNEKLNFNPVWFIGQSLTLKSSAWFSTAEAEEIAAMAGAGILHLEALQHRRFPLAKANEALAALADRSAGGFDNVVILP